MWLANLGMGHIHVEISKWDGFALPEVLETIQGPTILGIPNNNQKEQFCF